MAHSENNSLRVAVVQDGARLHYAVPLALHRSGALSAMFSEWFIKRDSATLFLSQLLRRFVGSKLGGAFERRCDEIPPDRVHIQPWLNIRQRRGRSKFSSDEAYYRWSSELAGNWIMRHGLGDANVLFGFIRNLDPTLCEYCRKRNILTVGDQMIAPATAQAREARLQSERWPGWEISSRSPDWALLEDVERRTWAQLDRITCPSDYVRKHLVENGLRQEMIVSAPYPIDTAHAPFVQREERNGPLVVGFVGLLDLRKGAPYFLEVARRMRRDNIRFVAVGPSNLSEKAAASFADSVQVVGRVPRSQVSKWLGEFDVFLFPSTCEGSAGVVAEAMASGLPIVTSPNAGSTVHDGVQGFIRDYDDTVGYAQCIERLAADKSLRLQMGLEARQEAENNNLDRYGEQLISALSI